MSIVIKDETAKKRIGDNLQAAMDHRGICQAELSRITGESNARISYYRRGMKLPSLAVASRLAEALRIPLESLLAKKIKIDA